MQIRTQPQAGTLHSDLWRGKSLPDQAGLLIRREEGRMWVFIRPRGGQECYLLGGENRREFNICPIHRFDRMDQIPSRP